MSYHPLITEYDKTLTVGDAVDNRYYKDGKRWIIESIERRFLEQRHVTLEYNKEHKVKGLFVVGEERNPIFHLKLSSGKKYQYDAGYCVRYE